MFRILYILSNEPNGGVGAVIENYVSHFHDRFIVDYLIYTNQRDTPFQKTIRTENNRIYYLPELRIRDYLSLQQKTNRFFREHARDYCIAHLEFFLKLLKEEKHPGGIHLYNWKTWNYKNISLDVLFDRDNPDRWVRYEEAIQRACKEVNQMKLNPAKML